MKHFLTQIIGYCEIYKQEKKMLTQENSEFDVQDKQYVEKTERKFSKEELLSLIMTTKAILEREDQYPKIIYNGKNLLLG